MAMAGADPFAIMKAMGHTDIKTTMIYVSLGKSHIREQVEKLKPRHHAWEVLKRVSVVDNRDDNDGDAQGR